MEQGPTQPVEQKPAEQPTPAQPAAPQPQKSSNKVVWIIVAIVVVLGIVVIGGGFFAMRMIKNRVSEKIGQSIGENMAEKAIEKATGQKADVSADGNSVSIKTDSGTMAASGEGNIKLPADFPTDVYVPSDAKITYALSTPANAATEAKASFMVAFGTAKSVNDVVATYKTEMAKNGWTVESEANYGAMMVSFTKGTRTVAVTAAATEGQDVKNGATGVSITGSES